MNKDVPFNADEVRMIGLTGEPDDGRGRKAGETKYPFDQLEVLHGFEVKRELGTVRDAARRYTKYREPGKKFVVRKTTETGWTRCIRVK